MREYEFKKYIYDNPNFIGEPFKISRKQATEIYEKGFPSACEIIEGAKKKYPVADWSEFDLILNRKETKQAKQRKLHYTMRYRLAAACIALFLLLSYFTLVPSGRALASEIIQFIVRLYGDTMDVILPKNEHITIPPDEPERFSNGAEFEKKTALHPVLVDGDSFHIDYLEYYVDEYDIHYLTAYYIMDNGSIFWTRQEWNHAPESFHLYTPSHGFQKIPLTDAYNIHIRIDENINEIEVALVLPDSVFRFLALEETVFTMFRDALQETMSKKEYVITERFPDSRITSPLNIYYDNFDNVYQETEFKPFYFDTDWLKLDSIELEEGALKDKTLRSYYLDENGATIYVIQTWNFKGGEIKTYSSLSDFQEIDLGGLYKIYYTFDNIDGEQSGLIMLRDSILSFSVYDQSLFTKLVMELEKEESLHILDNSMYIH